MKKIIFMIPAILLFASPCFAKKGGNPPSPQEPIECQAGEFRMIADAPPGWTVTFTNPCLSLAPGDTGNTTLNVTSPKNTRAGFYEIPITVIHPAGSEFNSSSSVTIYIEPKGKGNK